MAKLNTKPKSSPWGQDNPEKDRQHQEISQYRKATSILNPINMIDSLLGIQSKDIYQKPEIKLKEKISPRKYHEVLIYSFAKRTETRLDAQTDGAIREVIQKLKEQVVLLEKSEKNLATDITKIKVEQLPQRSGIYYLRFFEWLITVISQLREKVEEGRTWLNALTGKKKKVGYWKMYKKHGTSFGLSHERTLATQSG